MITINIEKGTLKKTNFSNIQELMEFLNESFGMKTTWAVPDEDITQNDKKLIKKAQETPWDELDNV